MPEGTPPSTAIALCDRKAHGLSGRIDPKCLPVACNDRDWCDARFIHCQQVELPKELAESRKLAGECFADHIIRIVLVAPQGMVDLFAFDYKRDRHHLWHVVILEELARQFAGVAVVTILTTP